MPQIIRSAVILSAEEVNAVIKVNKVFEIFVELNWLIKSMNDKEFRILEKSLELTKEELENGK